MHWAVASAITLRCGEDWGSCNSLGQELFPPQLLAHGPCSCSIIVTSRPALTLAAIQSRSSSPHPLFASLSCLPTLKLFPSPPTVARFSSTRLLLDVICYRWYAGTVTPHAIRRSHYLLITDTSRRLRVGKGWTMVICSPVCVLQASSSSPGWAPEGEIESWTDTIYTSFSF